MKILLLTSFFSPLNNIASSRMSAFKTYLEKKGCEVDVITRYYSEGQVNGKDLLIGYQAPENFSEDFIQKGDVYYTNYEVDNKKIKIFNSLPKGIKGLYSYLNTDIYQYGWLKYITKVFEQKLKEKKYDFIIASHAPAIAFEAAGILSKKYSIPWIADYRDLFIDFKINPVALLLKRYRQHAFLKSASGILFVSPGMESFFNKYATKKLKAIPAEIVYNGFDNLSYKGTYDLEDQQVIKEFENIKNRFDVVLVHSGSLYKGRNLDFFIDATSRLNEEKQIKAAIVLLGLSKNNFDQRLNADCFVLPRVSVNTSFYLQHQAHALLMPIYKDLYTGFSGKVFEYLYSGNFVFYDTNPHEDLKALLKDYPRCIEIKNYDTFSKEIFKLKEADHSLPKPDQALLEKLTRHYSVDLLFKFLEKLKLKTQ